MTVKRRQDERYHLIFDDDHMQKKIEKKREKTVKRKQDERYRLMTVDDDHML